MRTAWVLAVALLCGCADDGGPGGEGCPAFSKIVDGSFSRTATQLTWTLEVEDLPATLTFDQAAVTPNILEYAWGIDVDADRDGMEDWEVSASHFRFDGPEKVLAPLAGTQQDLWAREGAVGSITGDVEASLAGSTFTFVVEMSEDAELADVTEDSDMTYFAEYQYGATFQDVCKDTF